MLFKICTLTLMTIIFLFHLACFSFTPSCHGIRLKSPVSDVQGERRPLFYKQQLPERLSCNFCKSFVSTHKYADLELFHNSVCKIRIGADQKSPPILEKSILSQIFTLAGFRILLWEETLLNIARGTTDPWVDTITGGT